ncbi:hypothetical protein PYW07_014054 [Mythimna separata]|uniref:Beta-1,3-glucan-binding protein n=1 Tax=Mythimna separata TaxID=271217 RepID=A0AAD7YGA6_MYTSE|nr:hypothetical protein PYW07_014054 [Mythimna separata]
MSCVVQAAFLYITVLIAICDADYEVPEPTVEALYPRGFRVTLANDDYRLFGFRGNINKPFQGLSEGDIKEDVIRPKAGKWVYKNRDVELNIGDTIYYWIYIIKDGKGYMNTDLEYTVTGFVNEDGTPVGGQPNQKSNLSTPKVPSTLPQSDLIDTRYDPDCNISKTVVQGRPPICTGILIFNEEFDGTSLRELKKWDALIQFPEEPDYPFNVYIPDNTVSFEEGSLVITPVLTETGRPEGFLQQTLDLGMRCTGKVGTSECTQTASGPQILPPVTTAKITSRRTFNFMFGRVEVRAKLPYGSWIIPEINLEPLVDAYGVNDYKSGLMRVAFVRGNPGLAKKLYGGPVLGHTEPFRSSLLKEKIGIDNWHKEFHNYTMIWRPDGIDLLVDGEQYGTVNPGGGFSELAKNSNVAHASNWQQGTIMAPLDQMFHITLGLRAGGINDFSDDLEAKPWRNSGSKAVLDFWRMKDSWHPSWYNGAMRVDSVRVYAL